MVAFAAFAATQFEKTRKFSSSLTTTESCFWHTARALTDFPHNCGRNERQFDQVCRVSLTLTSSYAKTLLLPERCGQGLTGGSGCYFLFLL